MIIQQLLLVFPLLTLSEKHNYLRKLSSEDQCTVSSQDSAIEANSTLLLNFKGHPDDFTSTDYGSLAEVFVSAYQSLAENLCFELDNVNIDTQTEEEEDHRRLKNEPTIKRVLGGDITFNFSLFFLITFRCWFCPSNSHLLSNDGSRRHRELFLSQVDEFKSLPEPIYQSLLKHEKDKRTIKANEYEMLRNYYSERSLQEQDDNSNFSHGPQRSELLSKFNELLGESSYISLPIEQMTATSELQTMECASTTDDMTSGLRIQFQGNYSYLMTAGDSVDPRQDLEEIMVIEKAIKRAYDTINMVNPDTCDSFFRRVQRVRFVEASQHDYDDSESFVMTFNVEYDCRGCQEQEDENSFLLFYQHATNNQHGSNSVEPSNSNSFVLDDEIVMMDRTELNVDLREQGPVEPDCVCDVDASMFRAPTISEFSRALRDIVEVRRRKGKLNFIANVGGNDDDSTEEISYIYPTSAPVSLEPTPSPLRTLSPFDPVLDSDLYESLLTYPYELHGWTFGENSDNGDEARFLRYPLYNIPNGWPSKKLGEYNLRSYFVPSSDTETTTLHVEQILLMWSELKNDYNGDYQSKTVRQFMREVNFKAFLVQVSIERRETSDESSSVTGILVNFNTGSEATSTLIPLQEYKRDYNENFFEHDTCKNIFVGEAFRNTQNSCDDSHDIVKIKQGCLKKINVDEILIKQNTLKETMIQAQTITYGFASCLQQEGLSWEAGLEYCMYPVHEHAIVARLLADAVAPPASSCGSLIQSAEKCLSCEICSTESSKVQCCSDSDCSSDEICSNHSCFPNGSLRFTLTWGGNDDLDLHVISPTSGKDIHSKKKKEYPSNPEQGGQWKASFNKHQGNEAVVNYYAEQVSFPSCTPGEVYNFYVEQAIQAGMDSDEWKLGVYVDNTQVDSYVGHGSSILVFTYECP